MNIHKTPGRRPAHRRGFSLIELLLVLVILSVLAALIMPRFANRSEQARITAAGTDISTLTTAIKTFEIDNGRYPTTAESLAALMSAPSGLTSWHGPYLDHSDFKDPWGKAYIYRSPGQQNPDSFDLYSTGPNGVEGDADDITNW
jgi:general secretion pathway protein G